MPLIESIWKSIVCQLMGFYRMMPSNVICVQCFSNSRKIWKDMQKANMLERYFFQKQNSNLISILWERKYPGKDPLQKKYLETPKSVKFQCNTCHWKFPTSDKLRSHVKMEHAKVICDVCENAFNGSDLKKHCASIHGVLPNDAFKYQFCPMFF